jgi:hypothetical protein
MHLIALLIGLVIERLATQLFHWRRLRWLDRIIDAGFSQAERAPLSTNMSAISGALNTFGPLITGSPSAAGSSRL